MTEQAFSLTTLRTYWENYQQRLIATIAQLSSEQLALPAAPHQRSIGELLAHMIGARIWWFYHWMGEENAAILHWLSLDESAVPDTAALVTMFEETWRVIAPALSCWTAADMEHVVPPPTFVAEKESARTREWIVWHVLEHEIHHGGELSLALGSNGLQGIM
jgi:uncharacterized damage-inducible protein DinB